MLRPISRQGWVYILLVMTIFSCRKNDLLTSPETPAKPGIQLVNIQLTGRVTDELGEPVNGAIVRSGTQLNQSDINGIFSFNSLMVNPGGTLIEVSKAGFFTAFRTIEVLPESAQFAEVTLKVKQEPIEFNAQSGAVIELNAGSSLNFPAEALTDKISGQSYSGTVKLAAYALKTEDQQFFTNLPGIKGLTEDKKDVVLRPYAIINTELTGASGQSLQIANGKFVAVKFPIAAADRDNAPSPISIWHYEESNGSWTEAGKATKNGSFYEANLPHFSIWACATATPLVSLQANITDNNGAGIGYAKMQLYTGDGQQIISGISRADSKGYATLIAPANQQLSLRVLNECGDILLNKSITTGNSKLWLGKLQTGINGTNTITITGKVQNCKSGAIYNGHIELELEGRKYRAAIQEGNFSILVSRCSTAPTTAKLIAIDEAGSQESSVVNFEVQSGITDLGILSTCNSRNSQFVSYNINGTNYLLQAPGDSLVQAVPTSANKTIILCYSGADKTKPAFSFTFSGNTKPGQYPVTALSFTQDKLAFAPSGNIAVEITNYGVPGGFITGKCIGQVKSPTFSQVLPFSFNFRILRKY